MVNLGFNPPSASSSLTFTGVDRARLSYDIGYRGVSLLMNWVFLCFLSEFVTRQSRSGLIFPRGGAQSSGNRRPNYI